MLDLPPDVQAVLECFVTCELATLARDGTPVAWPVAPLLLPEREQVLLTTTIGFPAKAANIRRDPRVSLLYSDPAGSGLVGPPAVLVQGAATVSDSVVTWNDDLARHWRRVREVQPSSRAFSRPGVRWFLDWYFMRLLIHVNVQRVSWWPGGDTSRPPTVREVPGARAR